MRKIFAVASLVAMISGSAWAADLGPRYTKAPIAAPVFSWTGFYFGGDVGGVSQTGSGTSNFFQIGGNNNNSQTQSPSGSSVIGGVHVGYNWQFTPSWVLGIEADAQWLDPKSSFCRQTDVLSAACTDNGRGFMAISTETKWLSTVRGRLGWTFDRFMVYGTGGVAFGEVDTGIGFNCLVAGCGNSGTTIATAGTVSSTQTGWVAGAGIEWAVANDWLVRAEYLHVDLGSVTGTVFLPVGACVGGGPCGGTFSRDMRYDIGRFGVSYKFGAPLVAKY